jgi:tetratricopeptide (TPR) repeat protein
VPINFLAITLSAQLFQLVKEKSVQQKILAFAIAPAILVSTIFYVNSDKEKVNARLRSIGTWTYKSYYYGSTYMINIGMRGIKNIDEQIIQREKVIAELLPMKSKTDGELASLYTRLGFAYIEKGNNIKAAESFSKSVELDYHNLPAIKYFASLAMQELNFSLASDLFDIYNNKINEPLVTDSLAILYSQISDELRERVTSLTDKQKVALRLELLKLKVQSPIDTSVTPVISPE